MTASGAATGAAPTRIRDNVGIPIELALAAVDQRLREEGIRENVSLVVGGSIRSSADALKAILLGADAVYIGTAALLALGCHLCRSCHSGKCNWGIATQRPDLVERLDPEAGTQRLVNLVNAWTHEIKEMMGGMGINSIEAAGGKPLMLRGVGLTEGGAARLRGAPRRGVSVLCIAGETSVYYKKETPQERRRWCALLGSGHTRVYQRQRREVYQVLLCDVFGSQKIISVLPSVLPRAFAQGIAVDASRIEGFYKPGDSELFLFP